MHKAFWILGLPALTLLGSCASVERYLPERGPPADSRLGELHAALAPLRLSPSPEKQAAPKDKAFRGATPVFKTVKQSLRDWIEPRLVAMDKYGDGQALANRLNEELRRADLLCEGASEPSADRCAPSDGSLNATGFLGPISLDLRQSDHILVVRTGTGIVCGVDQSAYAYEWRDKKWRRFWQYEQNIEPDKPYAPMHIGAVNIAWGEKDSHERLVQVLGNGEWCASSFNDVYFSLWRADMEGGEPKLLQAQAQRAWLGKHEPPLEGSTGNSDALVEFLVPSLDIGVHSYETVRHYQVKGDAVTRIDPIALRPRSFTEEWLKTDWAESAGWTAPLRRDALKSWHDALHSDDLYGEFTDVSRHCRKDPELWQVAIRFGASDKPQTGAFFLIRWRPPYRFEMVEITRAPRPDCDEADEAADAEQTLFPVQDWR